MQGWGGVIHAEYLIQLIKSDLQGIKSEHQYMGTGITGY